MKIVFPILFVTFSALWVTSTAKLANVPRLPNDKGKALSSSGFVGSIVDTFSPQNLKKLWNQKLGPQAGQTILDEVTKTYSKTSRAVGELKETVNNLANQAQEIQGDLQTTIKKRASTIEHATESFSQEIGGIYEKLKDRLQGPPPENYEERSQARVRLVAQVTGQARAAYVYAAAGKLSVLKERAEKFYDDFWSMLMRLVLLFALIIVAIFLLSNILRFILDLLGFGLLGPIKGSSAALFQRFVFRGAVPRGSCFAVLQRLGMTVTSGWSRGVVGACLIVILALVVIKYSTS